MDNKELLQTIEETHNWTAKAILELRELVAREEMYTEKAIQDMKNEILTNIQLTITEMELLSFELEG